MLVFVVAIIVGFLTTNVFVRVCFALVEWMFRPVNTLWPAPVLVILSVAAVARFAAVSAVAAEFLGRTYARAEEKLVGGIEVVVPAAAVIPLLQGLCLEFGVVHLSGQLMFSREAELGARAWHIATLLEIDGADGLSSRCIADWNGKNTPGSSSSMHYGSVGTKKGVKSFSTHQGPGCLVSVILQVSHGRPNDVF